MTVKFKAMNQLGSIERFLLIFISVVFVVYVSATYLLSKSQIKHEMDEIFDPQLAHSAFLLFDLLGESVANIDQNSTGLPVIYHNFYGKKASTNLRFKTKIRYIIKTVIKTTAKAAIKKMNHQRIIINLMTRISFTKTNLPIKSLMEQENY